jgi:hypothetical protein
VSNGSDTQAAEPPRPADLKTLGDRLVGTWTISGEADGETFSRWSYAAPDSAGSKIRRTANGHRSPSRSPAVREQALLPAGEVVTGSGPLTSALRGGV